MGEQVMQSQELHGSCDEDCISSAGWLRCLPGFRSAHQTLVGGLNRFRDPEFTLELLGQPTFEHPVCFCCDLGHELRLGSSDVCGGAKEAESLYPRPILVTTSKHFDFGDKLFL